MTASWRQPNSFFRDAGKAGVALALLLATGAVFGVETASGVPVRGLSEEESSAELYAVVLDRSVLADAIPAYRGASGLLFPLGELCRIFEIEVSLDPRSSALRGRIPSNATFAVDGERLTLTIGDSEMPIEKGLLKVAEGDIFLGLGLLTRLLPVDLAVNANEATLTVTPRSPLPLQERLAREKRGDALRKRDERIPGYPAMRIPYRLFGGPFLDQTAQVALDPPSAGGSSQLRVAYSTHVAADLFWASFDGYLSGTQTGISDIRGTLGRKDPAAGLLGPLHATEAALGNVFSGGLELVMAPASGTGAVFSSFPVQHSAYFDRTALRGDLPSGWSLELFLNGDLLAFQRSRPDGLYEFLDVPVYFGVNVYRLVFYGPSGQRREETRTFSATETLTPAGVLRYRAGALDPSLRLLETYPASAGRRAWLEGEFGLSRSVALSAAVARSAIVPGGEERDYATAGLRASLGAVFFRGDLAFSGTGGRALQVGAQTRVGGVGILLQHAELRDYVTDWFRSIAGDVRRRSYLRFDGAIPKSFLPRLPLSLVAERAERTDGTSTLQLNGRLSAYVGGVSTSNQISWTHESGVGSTSDLVTGNLLVSRYGRGLTVQGGVNYSLTPSAVIQGGSLGAERRLGKGFAASASVTRSFQAGQTVFQMGVTRNEGILGYGLQAGYSSPEGLRAVAQLSVGIGRDDGGRWHASARQIAGTGALVGRTFLDNNANGNLDAGDQPLDQVRFLVNGSRTNAATDGQGSVFVPSLTPYQAAGVTVATETLADPFWKPAIEGVTIVPRPGRAPVISIPVLVTGEVTGSVFVQRSGSQRPGGGVKVELVDATGAVSKTAGSAWDGYFTLTEVRPGKYGLRIAAASLEKIGAESAATRTLEIGNDGTVLDGLDLVIVARSDGETSEPVQPQAAVSPASPAAAGSPLPSAPTQVFLQPPAPPQPATLKPAPAAAHPAAKPQAPTQLAPSGRFFALLVGSGRNRPNADDAARRFESQLGLKARVVSVDLGEKGTWHRIFVGEFTSRTEALAFRAALRPGSEAAAAKPLVLELDAALLRTESSHGATPAPAPATAIAPPVVSRRAPIAILAETKPARVAVLQTRDWAGKQPVFVVHVSSYRTREKADANMVRLAAQVGIVGHSVEVDLGDAGIWYRVVLGEFDSAASARQFALEIAPKVREGVGGVYRLESPG
ncbi:MAG: SPOR domain-containing protein [Holophagales bacterium]|nr:SPOR domain-containing protein [Holophagales bacterium]MBK9965033.1 SPOR domain-containing protein [Holophagales bacterium]